MRRVLPTKLLERFDRNKPACLKAGFLFDLRINIKKPPLAYAVVVMRPVIKTDEMPTMK